MRVPVPTSCNHGLSARLSDPVKNLLDGVLDSVGLLDGDPHPFRLLPAALDMLDVYVSERGGAAFAEAARRDLAEHSEGEPRGRTKLIFHIIHAIQIEMRES